jgi:hypothetical protein
MTTIMSRMSNAMLTDHGFSVTSFHPFACGGVINLQTTEPVMFDELWGVLGCASPYLLHLSPQKPL